MEFKLDKDQAKRLKEWQDSIKKKHGSYGHYTYKFTPTGIGNSIEVYSYITKKTLDLSDVDKW